MNVLNIEICMILLLSESLHNSPDCWMEFVGCGEVEKWVGGDDGVVDIVSQLNLMTSTFLLLYTDEM